MIQRLPPQWHDWCSLATCASYRFGQYKIKKIHGFSQNQRILGAGIILPRKDRAALQSPQGNVYL